MHYDTGIESNGIKPKKKNTEGIKAYIRTITAKTKEKVWRQLLAANGVAYNIWLTFAWSNQILRIYNTIEKFMVFYIKCAIRGCRKRTGAFDNVKARKRARVKEGEHTTYNTRSTTEDGIMNDKQECQWHRFHYLIQIPMVLPGNSSGCVRVCLCLAKKGAKEQSQRKQKQRKRKKMHWIRKAMGYLYDSIYYG